MSLPVARAATPEALAIQLKGLAGCDEVSVHRVETEPKTNTAFLISEFGRGWGGAPVELPSLVKWLRVNGRSILLPDSDQVIEDLPVQEQEWLKRGDARGCVPLVADGKLECVVLLHGRFQPSASIELCLADLDRWARGATVAWHQLVDSRRIERESAAAYRSQQLSTAGQLAASVAHEVRNPLAGVRSIVQLVKDSHPTAARHTELLTHVLEEVDRIDHTVSGFLGLAKPHDQESSLCDLGAMTADAAEFVQTSARRNGIHLSVLAQTNALVRVDPREFRQVLLNILLNAGEACKSGDSIQVSVDRTFRDGNPLGEVRVRDTGVGIPSDIVERIFDPFFTTKDSGTGLGLAVCRDLARKHGGDIRVESKVGVGTVVILEYPLGEHA